MTKNRARKKAARERAALTGERYVVARHSILGGEAPPAPSLSGVMTVALHRWTHLVPGVPSHPDTVTRAKRNAPHVKRVHPSHPARQKRVLRGWQERIERQVSR